MVLLMLLNIGCTEYHVGSKDDVSPGDTGLDSATPTTTGTPDLAVDPDAVSEIICGSTTSTVTLRNDGDAALTITDLSTSGSWILGAHDRPPLTLAPAESVALVLVGEPGTGTLTVESDDPDTPSWDVPLTGTVDQAPWAVILGPPDGTVMDNSADVALIAEVGDDVDPVEDLVVTWTSDVDGALGQATVTKAGVSQLTWPAASRTQGDQALSVQVQDSCGGTSGDELGVCQQAGYVVDELDLSGWHFEGDAQWDTANNWLQLTRAVGDVVGTAFKTDEIVSGDAVEISFLFYMGDGTGADGLSLTVIDRDRMSTFLGGTGCGIGYGGNASCTAGPALPGWTLEIDTYDNGVGVEPTPNDHLAFTFDGDVDAFVAWAELPEMEDTGWHELSVIVADPRVTVSVDGTTYIDQDVGAGNFAFEGYVGFTAGTGGLTNAHLIDSLEVTDFICEE